VRGFTIRPEPTIPHPTAMPERIRETDPLLNLDEDESVEHLDDQVQKAQEQLIQLKRQQEQIEKQKRELEELSRRQEQFQQGKAEMIEHFTRALVILERQIYDAQKRVEQLRSINESFVQHLAIIEAINPKSWENSDINKELNRALSAIDDARTEYGRSRAIISAETNEDVLPATSSSSGAAGLYNQPAHDFIYWLKSGVAFTLPLVLLGIAILIALCLHLSK
jgi:septal ring factor EnvC (AmiA/AmiB activator)